MATSKKNRIYAAKLLDHKFDEWSDMNDLSLLAELQAVMRLAVTTKSRHETLKYLVHYFVQNNFM